MRYFSRNPSAGGLFPRLTSAIKWLLIANVAVFILQWVVGGSTMFYKFGLVPRSILTDLYIWQFVTYMFLHGGFFHIFFNMFVLWMFGSDLERQWGPKYFLKYYFACGIGAGIITFLVTIYSTTPTVGASGAIYGLLVAFAVLYPNRTVLIYFLFPVKVKYLVLFLIGISLISSLSQPGDGIAHVAHLSGAMIGYLYLKTDGWWFRRLFKNPLSRFRFKRRVTKHVKKEKKRTEVMEEVDRILDRISEVGGYDNLTDKEKKILENAAKKLSGKKD